MTQQHVLRPRLDRIAFLAAAVAVTVFALLAGLGLFGAGTEPAPEFAVAGHQTSLPTLLASGRLDGLGDASPPALAGRTARLAASADIAVGRVSRAGAETPLVRPVGEAGVALPPRSGDGRRVVFDMSAQRVWLVDDDGTAKRSYLVSGSLTGNLHPGQYHVYSRSRWAVGVSDSGVMEYFVRFTRGDNAAIGFHSIPTKNGQPLQSVAQLGTPQSHGCIRQNLPDAIALWDFAAEGTSVDVVA